ncbi:cytochrome c3 family protein [Geomonas agri]|uniref:cytochrome c3 family protein n=1 Tax=Geomonas agri TaxID=2873702 RepID=UPI001CD354CF|nr:cytochrome c3 family protein [Geomonas agri]
MITPPDRSAVTGEWLALVLSHSGFELDTVQIFVNNRKQKTVSVPTDRKIVCIDGVMLSPGENRIRVVTIKDQKKVGEHIRTVALRVPLSPANVSLPEGFTDYKFHGTTSKLCDACHRIDFKGQVDAAGTGEKSPCYICHKKLLSDNPVVHGPAAVWSCLTCHTQLSGKGAPGALSANKRICVECHEEPISLWKSKKYIHGPLVDDDCIVCHNPHAASFSSLLRKSPYDLCTTCHDLVPKTPHVIESFSGGGHPLLLPRNPLKPGSEFSCVSCHNPHAGDSLFFLSNYRGPDYKTEYCRTCHTF